MEELLNSNSNQTFCRTSRVGLRDMVAMHGISHTDVFRCVWRAVDVANACPELVSQFPKDHDVQRQMAQGFFAKSKAAFEKCCH